MVIGGRAVPWAIALVVVNGSGGRGVSSRRRPWMELEGNEMELELGPDVEDCRLGLE